MSSGRLARNVAWNFLGAGVPIVVAVLTIPTVIERGGAERFGLLGIVWVLIGYFSLFDLGLGRALTKLVSEEIAKGRSHLIQRLMQSALSVMLLLGLLVAVAVFAGAPLLVSNVLSVPDALVVEGISSIRIMTVALPFVVISTAFTGMLEAHQRFDVINVVRIPIGAMTFLAPYLAFLFTPDLRFASMLIAIVRIASSVVLAVHALRLISGRSGGMQLDILSIKRLVSFGGWLTLSNVIGPLLVYFDRFVIGAMLGLIAVAHYVTPFEIVTRLWILPVAVLDVLFPELTKAFIADRTRLVGLFGSAISAVTMMMIVPVSTVYLFASDILGYWLGDEYHPTFASVTRLLVLGIFINSICRVPQILLQGAGKPDWIAKLHLAELVPYFFLLVLLIDKFGVSGAALAWTIRVSIDGIVNFYLAGRLVGPLRRQIAYGVVAAFGAPLAIVMLSLSGGVRTQITVVACLVAFVAYYFSSRLSAIFAGAREGKHD